MKPDPHFQESWGSGLSGATVRRTVSSLPTDRAPRPGPASVLEAPARKRIFRTRPSVLETQRPTSANQVIRQQKEVKAVADLPHPDCGILSNSVEQINDKAGYVLSLNMTRPEEDQLSSLILVSQVVLTVKGSHNSSKYFWNWLKPIKIQF